MTIATRLAAIASLAAPLFFAATGHALAERNVALVIGNSAYQHVTPLPNPVNDAASIAQLFKAAGFEVVDARQNLGVAEMRKVLRDFGDRAAEADVAVVYYAGHGMEVDGGNYLVPVDAVLERDVDIEDEAVSLDRVLRTIEPAKRLRLVILDACRDNPFSRSMKRTLGTRSVGRGLARIEPGNSDTLVAFAAKAGSTASDGNEQHSPFTTALLQFLPTPGLDIRLAFGKIRDQVIKATGNKQEPFVYGSLGGDTVALVPGGPLDINADARADYEYTAQIATKQAWESFLTAHPTGIFADLARAQMAKLDGVEQASAKADDAVKQAKVREAGASDAFKKMLEQQAAAQAEDAKKQLPEAEKKQFDEARKLMLEQAKREVDEAARAVETAQRQADEAARKIEDTKKAMAEDARRRVEDAKREAEERARTAALAPSMPQPPAPPPMDLADVTRLLQAHLKRIGCDPGNVDGTWNDGSIKAMTQFNKYASTKFDVKIASLDALDAVRTKTSRVCPLVCSKGQKISGDQCIRITCDSGFMLDDDSGACIRRPVAAAPKPAPKQASRPAPSAPAAAPSHSGGGGGGRCFTFNGKRFCE